MEFRNSLENKCPLYFHFLDGYLDSDYGSNIQSNIKFVKETLNFDYTQTIINNIFTILCSSGKLELANIETRLASKLNPAQEDELADMIEHLSIYKDLTF